jgi:hypothetical protein
VLRGRVLAAVDWSISLGDRTPYRLWWLTLSPDGTRVDASGPVALDGPEVDPSLDWREPVVSPVAEGGYQLAWLLHRDRHAEGDLYVAPFRAGGRRAEPTVDMAQARKIAGNVHVARPAFSPDGESVYAVQRQAGKLPAVRKFSVHGEWISRRPGDDGRQWSDASPSRLTTSGRFDDGPPTR